MFNNFFPPKTVPFMRCGKKTVQPDGQKMSIRRMRIACWIPKATNTHQQLVILLFQYKNGCMNAPQCYDIRTLSVLLHYMFHYPLTVSQFLYIQRFRTCPYFDIHSSPVTATCSSSYRFVHLIRNTSNPRLSSMTFQTSTVSTAEPQHHLDGVTIYNTLHINTQLSTNNCINILYFNIILNFYLKLDILYLQIVSAFYVIFLQRTHTLKSPQ